MSGPLPTNGEVADRLELLGDLLELEGAVRHRVLAYRRAAARARGATQSLAALALAGRAVEIPDIGATLQSKIAELATTGDIAALAKLRARVPEGLARISHLEGIGPKRAMALHAALGVRDLADLRAQAATGRLAEVPGLGPKTRAALAAQLEALDEDAAPARMSLGRALPLAREIAAALAELPGVHRVEVAGSLRRGKDRVGDIDLVASADDPDALAGALAGHPTAERTLASGPAKTQVLMHAGIRLELRAGPPESFGNLLQHCTGSAAHNVRLREAAVRMGLSMSEHGIQGPDGGVARHAEEDAVYAALGLASIPPELREDRGEIDRARSGELPRLVEEADLRGDLHAHTDWSDGKATIVAMARAARERGYEYLAISDHSGSLAMAGGLDPERVRRQWEAIDEAARHVEGIRLLKATEVDVLADGRLDFEDDLLAGFDFVTASVHSAFRVGRDKLTARVLAAIESPFVRAIGHPTGRMMGRREGYALDFDRVFARAAETGTWLEINSQPARLDLNDELARRALAVGVRLTIGSDAHATAALGFIGFGVKVARRAGATAADIANTRPWEELRRASA